MARILERIDNFNKFFELYKETKFAYDSDNLNNIYKLALMRSFELNFELSWKILKDYLFLQGINTQFPRDTIKESFNSEIIKNGQIWIDMLEARNITSHEYNMDKVDNILIKMTTIFFEEMKDFHLWINDKNF